MWRIVSVEDDALTINESKLRKTCVQVAYCYNAEDDAFIINKSKLRMELTNVVHIQDIPYEGETPNIKETHKDEQVEAQRRKKQQELFNAYKDTTGSTINF